MLTSGAIYEVVSRIICNRSPPFPTVDTLLPPKLDISNKSSDLTINWITLGRGFLDTLMEHGYLDFKASFKDCVKGMIADRTPFFESIHSNIIEAFMSSSMDVIKVEDVVQFLR
jgi:hypothetical protein